MARDYEDIFDTDDLDDEELRRLVRETLRDNNAIDPTNIAIHVRDGRVILAGRVGTEEERRIAERVVADRIGLERIQNQMVVDPIRRAVSPEAVDEHLADNERTRSLLLGDEPEQETDTTRSLDPDYDAELDGTVDRMESMEEGVPWIPPESPTPEGLPGTGPEDDAQRDSY
jgi:hypothetical protein